MVMVVVGVVVKRPKVFRSEEKFWHKREMLKPILSRENVSPVRGFWGFTPAWCERCLVFETSTRNIQKPRLEAAGSKDSALPTLPETNSSPLKIAHPKRKRSSSNHPFSGAFAASFREGAIVFLFFVFAYFCLAGAYFYAHLGGLSDFDRNKF